MKVYVHYEEGGDAELHVTLKLTLPKRWNDESPMKLLQVCRQQLLIAYLPCVALVVTEFMRFADAIRGTNAVDKWRAKLSIRRFWSLASRRSDLCRRLPSSTG